MSEPHFWVPNLYFLNLLLYNKLLKTLGLKKNNKQPLSHSFCDQKFRSGLAGGFWFGVTHKVSVEMAAKATGTLET